MEIEVVIVLKTKHGLSPKYSVNIKYIYKGFGPKKDIGQWTCLSRI